jgi:hypothetical protein
MCVIYESMKALIFIFLLVSCDHVARKNIQNQPINEYDHYERQALNNDAKFKDNLVKRSDKAAVIIDDGCKPGSMCLKRKENILFRLKLICGSSKDVTKQLYLGNIMFDYQYAGQKGKARADFDGNVEINLPYKKGEQLVIGRKKITRHITEKPNTPLIVFTDNECERMLKR